MVGRNASQLILSALLVALCANVAEAQQTPAAKESSVLEVTTPPASSVTKLPAELAPNPPRVSCGEGGRLTIAAESSTLRSILVAVQGCTGVPIVMPETGADERFYLQLGPGPAIEVLGALLASTDIDYVISPADAVPGKIAKVLLFARSKSTSDAKATAVATNHEMTPARRAWLASRNVGRSPASSLDSDESKAVESNEEPAAGLTNTQTQFQAPAPTPEATETAASQGTTAEKLGLSQSSTADTSTAPAGLAASTADAAAKSTPDDPADPAASQPPPTPSTAPVAAPESGEDNAKPKDNLENKITDMQKMFEQRKKLGGDASPNQN